MRRIAVTVLLASMLAVPVGGCATISDFTIDPAEWFSGDWFGNKKPLPGERKRVFPEGVPGVSRGIPPELVKGHQEQPEADVPPAAQQAAVADEKPKQKAKAKPKVAAKPAAPADDEARTTAQRAPASPAQQPAAGQWPDPPPSRGTQGSGGDVQWPDPPPSRGAQTSGGGVQWPSPPPPR